MGYVSFGFEGGQHDTSEAIDKHVAFINLSLSFSGSRTLSPKEHVDWHNKLRTDQQSVFEIYHRQSILTADQFNMLPGFTNFHSVEKGTQLATINKTAISTDKKTTVFMPLYQSQGSDGFFLIREINPFFLWLSGVLRRIKFDHILPILPGVSWTDESKSVMRVNLKIARFFTKPFLHLLGYRSKTTDNQWLTVRSREAASRFKEYQKLNKSI